MADSVPKIRLDSYGLGKILKEFFVRVPLNQRDYAWKEDNVTQLFTDFTRAQASDEEHFVGSIVTIPVGREGLEVVDGQQRLATTAMLLGAIKARLETLDEPMLVRSVTSYISDIDRERKEEVPKLTLNVDDNDLFRTLLLDGPPDDPGAYRRPSHKLLIKSHELAARQVDAILKPYGEKDHADALNQWIDFIEHQAVAVLLRVPDSANAFRMFETLNDRGLKVSQADLVKNHLYSVAGERQPEVQARWTQMRSILETLDDDDIPLMLFLRHALIVLEGHMREVDVFEKVQGRAKSSQTAVTFAAQLQEMANTYTATFNPEHEKWSASYPGSARKAVEVFNLFKLKPMRPLIVAIAREMSPKETGASFQFLVSLGVRLIIASTTRSASVEIPLSTAAYQVFDGTITTANELRKALEPITPSDSVFRHAFSSALVSNPRFARYYLRSLERQAQDTNAPYFMPEDDPHVITLEHVLPQSPEGNWPSYDAETAGAYVNRLGNQALLTRQQNSDLKSNAFADKKAVYAASPYVLTAQIGEMADWTPANIEDRQEKLAELAVKTWPIK